MDMEGVRLMRRFGGSLFAASLVLITAVATAQNQAPGGNPGQQPRGNEQAANALRMEQLLKNWEGVSQQNENLYAKFDRTDTDQDFGSSYFEGEALFRKPNLACIDTYACATDKNGKKIVDAEDKHKPLSDQKIADILKGEGLTIARRTVTKYREAMNIPATNLRKEY